MTIAEPCPDDTPHAPHVWRPDGKRITANARPDALRSCPGREAPPASMREAIERELDEFADPDVALAQLARVLADQLDAGAGMATAAVARELRATLEELRRDSPDDDTATILHRLSAPLGNATTA